ncbi:MAG: flagellar motor switch protein FliG, partial [Halioglobus sp.]|nr:flagellar motor switch protein FliG [Halioglobus sp.]
VDGEHPQIVAIVIAYLDSQQAAEVIELLPEEMRTEVVIRIARLSDVQQSALAEIENLIASKASDKKTSGSEKVGGDKVAADIINSLGAAKGEEILDKIKERNEDLSNRIQEKMFVFDTLLKVDDRGIQSLLREVSNDLLVVALKGCDPAVRDKILRNMSKRASALLSEDMDARGPIKLSEVELAQKEILDIARRMADAGDLNLGQGGEQYV